MVRHRVTHVIKANHSNQRPTRMLFVDIESRLEPMDEKRTEHRLWFGYALFWRRRPTRKKDTLLWYRFDDTQAFWELVASRTHTREPLYLIAHNVAYDFGVLRMFDHLPDQGFRLGSFYTSGHTSILRFAGEDRKIVVLDNGNYFPGKLAKWGTAIGFPKMDVDPLTEPLEKVDPYCKRDAEIMFRLWRDLFQFLDEHDLGCWGVTLPSQAFNAYRHRFMKTSILVHDDEPTLAMEREAYHGGRTSIFYKGKLDNGPYYKLDINSMYPYVMSKNKYPVRWHRTQTNVPLRELCHKMERYAVIAECSIQTDERFYAVKHRGHLVHPIGQFRTTLTTPELRHALARGHLQTVHRMAYYDQSFIFQEYVSFFYEQKLSHADQEDDPYYAFAKLYLNSLYGKFGQRAMSWEKLAPDQILDRRSDALIDTVTGEYRLVYRFGDTYWERTEEGESFNSCPAIAAHVTAYARSYLYALCERCGWGHVFYTDTDSIITDAKGLARLHNMLDDHQLGLLKIEKQADHVQLRAPKCYSMGSETRRKGVPSHAQEIAPDKFQFERFASFLTQAHWEPGNPYHTQTTHRKLTYEIYDGEETEDGWIVPYDANKLHVALGLCPHDLIALENINTKIEAYKKTLPISHSLVFRLWDYRKGDFKRAWRKRHSPHLRRVEITDSLAQEEGFPDVQTMKEAILEYLRLWREIQDLELERNRLLRTTHQEVTEPKTDPLPF